MTLACHCQDSDKCLLLFCAILVDRKTGPRTTEDSEFDLARWGLSDGCGPSASSADTTPGIEAPKQFEGSESTVFVDQLQSASSLDFHQSQKRCFHKVMSSREPPAPGL